MKGKQLGLNVYKGTRGGRRPGSGRKRVHSRGIAHRTREKVSSRTPLHINFKYRTAIKNKQNLRLLKKAIMNARKHGLKIIHFSMQSNHMHFIIEADNNAILTKGMRSLTVTFAKGLARGKVQVERYHLHVLKTVREAKNAVMYVLFNKQNHEKSTYSQIDDYSSLFSLDGALKLVSEFAKNCKITLSIKVKEKWRPDEARSFLLRRASNQLV